MSKKSRRHNSPRGQTAVVIKNTGYSGSGASRKKNYARGWEYKGGSPVEDINKNLDTLRQRSRDLWMNSPVARAAISRIRTNAVGTGLKLQCTPNAEVLGITQDEASAWARRMEWEFTLWADSRNCDALGLNTFGELQMLALLSWLQSGDCFALLPMRENDETPYELCVHLIEADRVRSPSDSAGGGGNVTVPLPNGNKLINGVEVDPGGRTVAYMVSRTHPLTTEFTEDSGKFDRVPVRDPASGKLNILHMMVAERPEQRRGVPLLAPVIESLKQLTRYGEAELTAAVVAGLFTVFIKSETPQSPLGESGGIPDDERVSKGAPDEGDQYELAPGSVNSLLPGEDIASATPGRPNAGFEAFFRAVMTEVGAALDIPLGVLLQSHDASYSASRAALLDFWKTVRYWREALINNFCRFVFREFAWEAVLLGRVDAPGFVDDYSIREAWLSSEWHGPAAGQIDPLKEAMAAEKRLELGISTLAREAMELTGTDWETNIRQRGIESQAMADAGLSLPEQSSANSLDNMVGQLVQKALDERDIQN